jgi:hypothetical protein
MQVPKSAEFAWCAELPEFDPGGDGWGAISARRSRIVVRRRAVSTLALAAMLALPATVGWRMWHVPAETDPEAAEMAQLARHLPSDAAGDGARRLESALARFDRELQAAYDRRAPDAELNSMWQTRHELEDALALAYRRPQELVAL